MKPAKCPEYCCCVGCIPPAHAHFPPADPKNCMACWNEASDKYLAASKKAIK